MNKEKEEIKCSKGMRRWKRPLAAFLLAAGVMTAAPSMAYAESEVVKMGELIEMREEKKVPQILNVKANTDHGNCVTVMSTFINKDATKQERVEAAKALNALLKSWDKDKIVEGIKTLAERINKDKEQINLPANQISSLINNLNALAKAVEGTDKVKWIDGIGITALRENVMEKVTLKGSKEKSDALEKAADLAGKGEKSIRDLYLYSLAVGIVSMPQVSNEQRDNQLTPQDWEFKTKGFFGEVENAQKIYNVIRSISKPYTSQASAAEGRILFSESVGMRPVDFMERPEFSNLLYGLVPTQFGGVMIESPPQMADWLLRAGYVSGKNDREKKYNAYNMAKDISDGKKTIEKGSGILYTENNYLYAYAERLLFSSEGYAFYKTTLDTFNIPPSKFSEVSEIAGGCSTIEEARKKLGEKGWSDEQVRVLMPIAKAVLNLKEGVNQAVFGMNQHLVTAHAEVKWIKLIPGTEKWSAAVGLGVYSLTGENLPGYNVGAIQTRPVGEIYGEIRYDYSTKTGAYLRTSTLWDVAGGVEDFGKELEPKSLTYTAHAGGEIRLTYLGLNQQAISGGTGVERGRYATTVPWKATVKHYWGTKDQHSIGLGYAGALTVYDVQTKMEDYLKASNMTDYNGRDQVVTDVVSGVPTRAWRHMFGPEYTYSTKKAKIYVGGKGGWADYANQKVPAATGNIGTSIQVSEDWSLRFDFSIMKYWK